MSLRNLSVCRRRFHLIVIVGLILSSCSGPDLSTPEKTMATYYKGYMTGKKSLTEKTLMGMGPLSDIGFKPPSVESYRIIEKKEVLRRSDFAEGGDVEVLTEVRLRNARPPEKFHFVLRKYDWEWKIVSYSSSGEE